MAKKPKPTPKPQPINATRATVVVVNEFVNTNESATTTR